MVLEGVVSTLLNSYLGAFIEGLDASQLRLNVWSGSVRLRSLSIKPSALDFLHLPLRIRHGSIDSLKLEANWLQLSTQPVRVELSGVQLLVEPRADFELDEAAEAERLQRQKARQLETSEELWLQAEREAADSHSSTARYMARMRDAVLDNLQLSIRDVHLRLVSPQSAQAGQEAAGVGLALQELSCFTTNSDGQPDFSTGQTVGHRRLQLSGLCLYSDEGGAALSVAELLGSGLTRFLLSPVSLTLQLRLSKDEAASPRFELESSSARIALSLAQPQYRHLLRLLSQLSASAARLQSALAASPSLQADGRALDREERQRYIRLYQSRLNALWLPQLSAEDRAALVELEREGTYASLNAARRYAWSELKKELRGRTVMRREQAEEEARKAAGSALGLLRRRFGTKLTREALQHEELSEQQKEDLEALLDSEDGGGPRASHPPGWLLLSLHLQLATASLTLLDATWAPMLTVKAEGGDCLLRRGESSTSVELSLASVGCEETMLSGSRYAALITMQTAAAAAAAASAPAPFLHALYEDQPAAGGSDKRLSVRVSSPVLTLHQPLLAAMLRFLSVPDAVDLQSFSHWSRAQLDSLRSFSAATLAETLLAHQQQLELSVDLAAPIIVCPLLPTSDAGDVLVLNLGRLRLSSRLQDKAGLQEAMAALQAAGSDAGSLSAEVRGRLYDRYELQLTETTLFLSAAGRQWAADGAPSVLLQPLDLQLQLGKCIRQDVSTLPALTASGQLQELRLTVSDGKLRRTARFLRLIADVGLMPAAVTAKLIAADGQQQQQQTDSQPQAQRPLAAPSTPSAVAPASPAVSRQSSRLELEDLTALFGGSERTAREALRELDADGDGVVERSELEAWQSRRLQRQARQQQLQLDFLVQQAAVELQQEPEAGATAAVPMLVAAVSGIRLQLLKEPHVTSLSLQLASLSASDVSEPGRRRLIVETQAVAAEQDGEDSGGGGFVEAELQLMAASSPDFPQRRVEAALTLRVGELDLTLDVQATERLGSFLLFHLLPAATSALQQPTGQQPQQAEQSPATRPAAFFPSASSSSSSPSSSRRSSVSPAQALPREHQTRLSVSASFHRLRVRLVLGAKAVSEADVSGLSAELRLFLHSLSLSARLAAVTLWDRSRPDSLYPTILSSLPATPEQGVAAAGEEAALVSLQLSTFSRLDASPPAHRAELRARLRGLRFVLLRRFVTEHLTLALTGPLARLLRQWKKQQAKDAAKRPQPQPQPLAASARRRSSVVFSALPPAPDGREEEDEEEGGALSVWSASQFLQVDCSLSGVELLLPHSSSSSHLLQARFDSIAVSNGLLDGQRTRLQAGFSSFTVSSSVQMSHSQRVEAHLLSLSQLRLQLDSQDADALHRKLTATLTAGELQASLCPSQLSLLRSLPDSNGGEEAVVARELLKQSRTQPRARKTASVTQAAAEQTAAAPPALPAAAAVSPSFVPSPTASSSQSPELTVEIRVEVPSVRLELLEDEELQADALPQPQQQRQQTQAQTQRRAPAQQQGRSLLRLTVLQLSTSLLLEADGSLRAEAGLQSVVAVDSSQLGQSIAGRPVLESRKELLRIVAAPASASSALPPLHLTLSRTASPVLAADGTETRPQQTAVAVTLAAFRFSMAAVLLRLAAFLPAASAAADDAALQPALAGEEREDDREALDFSLLSSPPAAAPPPAVPRSVLLLHLRMERPVFQMLADPTLPVSPALLLSLSASLSLEMHSGGAPGEARLQLSGGLQSVSCSVTELDADSEEAGSGGGSSEARCLLQPFSASLQLIQAGSAGVRLPRRSAALSVDAIVLRVSYSSYRLVRETLDTMLALQPAASTPQPAVARLVSDGVSAAAGDAGIADGGFALTSAAGQAERQLSLFPDEESTLSLHSLQLLLINDARPAELPFAKLELDRVSAAVHSFSHHRSLRLTARASLDVFDPALVAWTPLLEPYAANLALVSSVVPSTAPQLLPPAASAAPASRSASSATSWSPPTVSGSLTHWALLSSSAPLNLTLSQSLLAGCSDAVALFSRAEQSRRQRQERRLRRSQAEQAAADEAQREAAEAGGGALPFRLVNATELLLRCFGQYSLRQDALDSGKPPPSSDAAGPWLVAPFSSLPFAFPSSASPVNQSLVVELEARPALPELVIPFMRPRVTQHRMPGRAQPAVVVVSDIYVEDGVKVCRIRSRLGLVNRTDVPLAWRDEKETRGWPTLQPHSAFFLPLLPPPPAAGSAPLQLQLRPAAGGFSFCRPPLSVSGERVTEERVSRLLCARVGLAASSSASLSFTGDFSSVVSAVSVTDWRLQAKVEDAVLQPGRRGGARARQGKRRDSDDDGEDEDEDAAAEGAEAHATLLTLRPPAVVENLLPAAIDFRCLERSSGGGKEAAGGGELRQLERVESGCRVSLFSPTAAQPSFLSFRLLSSSSASAPSAWTAALPLLGSRDDVSRAVQGQSLRVAVRDADGSELQLQAAYSLQQGCVLLSLFAPYWLFDETGLGLVLSADRRQLFPSPSSGSGGRQQDDERPACPFNFPAGLLDAEQRDRTVALSTARHLQTGADPDGLWSAPFNIDTVGLRFSASIPPAPVAGLRGGCEVGVSIEQGAGVFRRTKLLVLAPRLVLVNQLQADVELRQVALLAGAQEQQPAVRVSAGEQQFWQWPDASQRRLLSMRRVGDAELEAWSWSGAFNPARVGAGNLLVRHLQRADRFWFLRLEVRVQEATVFCVLSAYPQEPGVLRSVLPYRLQNRALFHSLRFRQQRELRDGGREAYGPFIVVPPQSDFAYAYEQPPGSELELELGLAQSLAGERWDAALNCSLDKLARLGSVRMKPLPGDETREPQRLFLSTEMQGPTRVLTVSPYPSLEQAAEEIRAAAASRGRRVGRRELNEQLRLKRQEELQSSLELLSSNIAQLRVNRSKQEERLQGLVSGVILRPPQLQDSDSALSVRVLAARGLRRAALGSSAHSAADFHCVVDFNGAQHRAAATACSLSGGQGGVELSFEDGASSGAQFRANALRLSTVCRLTVFCRSGSSSSARSAYGCAELRLSDCDDHQQRRVSLPLLSLETGQLVGGELELEVWWIPQAEREVRGGMQELDRVLADYERVKASVQRQLRRVSRGQLEGVLGSANTEVLFLVRVSALAGLEAALRRLPEVGGRIVVRVTSQLTGKASSALLFAHASNIRLCAAQPDSPLTTPEPVQAGGARGAISGQPLPVLVSEDLLDRGAEVLHFQLLFIRSFSSASPAAAAQVAIAAASVPLDSLPVSSPDALKRSEEEKQWTDRSIPLQPQLPVAPAPAASSSSSSSSSSPPLQLAMIATFRRFRALGDDQRAELKLTVSLPVLGLSVVNAQPEELLYLSLQRISLSLEQAPTLQALELKVDGLQLDDQRASALFPVVVAPSFVPPEERQPALQLSLTKDRGIADAKAKAQFAVWSFPYFSLLVQSLDVRVEDELVFALLRLLGDLTRLQRGAADGQQQRQAVTVRRVSDVRLRVGSSQHLFFSFFQIQPLSFHVSFKATAGLRSELTEQQLYGPLQFALSAASSTLGSIDNAALRLNGQIIENASGTASVLLSALLQFYQTAALRQAYKLLGAFDFLGNPSELLSNLGTGLSDFFYEPAKGLVSSPQDFGRGVARGSLSLLKNTFGGLLSAASRITNSMGKAAAFLSMDDKFARQQQVRSQQQPASAAEGVIGGVQSLGMGVYHGVTGVVLDPLKGAQRGGVEGFLRGVGKGLAGVIAKPTAGLIDLTSQTLRGVGNSVSDQTQAGRQQQLSRFRRQRSIDQSGLILPYDETEAERADRRRAERRRRRRS